MSLESWTQEWNNVWISHRLQLLESELLRFAPYSFHHFSYKLSYKLQETVRACLVGCQQLGNAIQITALTALESLVH